MRFPTDMPVWIRLTEGLAALLRAVGRWIVAPVEWLAGGLWQAVLEAIGRLERIEELVVWLAWILAAPVRWTAGGAGWLVRRAGLLRVADGLAAAAYAVMGGVWRAAEYLNLDWLLRAMVWIAWPLWRPLAAALGFVYAWLATREVRQVLWGLPAVVLLVPFATVAYMAWSKGSAGGRAVVPAYRQALQAAAEEGDLARARLYEQKLAQLGVSTQASTLEQAERLAGEGRWDEARALVEPLAPRDRPGYPAAHLWMLCSALGEKLKLSQDERDAVVAAHTQQLTALGIDGPMLRLIRARDLVRDGRSSEAIALLEPLAEAVPNAALELLRLRLLTSGGPDADGEHAAMVRQDAEAVVRHARAMRASGKALEAGVYRVEAVAHEVLGREGETERVYEEWQAAHPDDEEPRRLLLGQLQRKAGRLAAAANSNPEELAALLVRAAKLGARRAWLARTIARLQDQDARAIIPTSIAERTLQAVISHDQVPVVLLEAAGIQSAEVGKMRRAAASFERMTQMDPEKAVAWNNLAWVRLQMAMDEQPSAEREALLRDALASAQRALELRSEAHRFRETRGQIYLQLKQWDQAIADLEYAMNGMPGAREVHASLAVAYEAVGEADLAAVHAAESE